MAICKAALGHRHAGVSPRVLATFPMKLNAQPGAGQRVTELMSHPLIRTGVDSTPALTEPRGSDPPGRLPSKLSHISQHKMF